MTERQEEIIFRAPPGDGTVRPEGLRPRPKISLEMLVYFGISVILIFGGTASERFWWIHSGSPPMSGSPIGTVFLWAAIPAVFMAILVWFRAPTPGRGKLKLCMGLGLFMFLGCMGFASTAHLAHDFEHARRSDQRIWFVEEVVRDKGAPDKIGLVILDDTSRNYRISVPRDLARKYAAEDWCLKVDVYSADDDVRFYKVLGEWADDDNMRYMMGRDGVRRKCLLEKWSA